MNAPVYALWVDDETRGRAARYAQHAQERFGAEVWLVAGSDVTWVMDFVRLYAPRMRVARVLSSSFSGDAGATLAHAVGEDRPSRLVYVAEDSDVAVEALQAAQPGGRFLACMCDDDGMPNADTYPTWTEVLAFLRTGARS